MDNLSKLEGVNRRITQKINDPSITEDLLNALIGLNGRINEQMERAYKGDGTIDQELLEILSELPTAA